MKNIALAMSGGGFRAAAFALGTLDYLNECQINGKPVLENVSFIGSTSGGSLTSIFYTLNLYNNKNFRDIYTQMLKIMDGESLVKSVFEILNEPKNWADKGTKGRNLINAFAIAYSKEFSHKTFSDVFLRSDAHYTDKGHKVPHIKEISINATEFSNGISFRFQSQGEKRPRGKIGNNYIYIKDTKVAGKLLLGDLMACSSCFSGGFEPVIFPDDFVHADLKRDELTDALYYKENPFTIIQPGDDLLEDKTFKKIEKRFGIMDGGIADNQAIESVLRANSRNPDDAKFDLIILTDVTSYFLDAYTLPMEGRAWYVFFKITYLKWMMISFILLALGCIGASFAWVWKDYMTYLCILGGISLLTFGFIKFKLSRLGAKAELQQSTWLLILMKYGGYFIGLNFNVLKNMIQSRLKSVFLLANDIYLKQIRKLYYEKIYMDPKLKPIVVSNAIYDLSKVKMKAEQDEAIAKEVHFTDDFTSKPSGAAPSPPSAQMVDIAEKARLMPTTLWFDKFQMGDKKLEAILETGKFTTCYNLLKHLIRLSNQGPLSADDKLLKDRLEQDWEDFRKKDYSNILN
jgi:predicted acylesterase/phospholipase RssA